MCFESNHWSIFYIIWLKQSVDAAYRNIGSTTQVYVTCQSEADDEPRDDAKLAGQ